MKNYLHITNFTYSLIRSLPNLFWWQIAGNNQLHQKSFKSVQGFCFYKGSTFGLFHRNEVSLLTQGLNYRSACDQLCQHRHKKLKLLCQLSLELLTEWADLTELTFHLVSIHTWYKISSTDHQHCVPLLAQLYYQSTINTETNVQV